MTISYYGIQNDQNELSHFGRKGMRWGEHIFGQEEALQKIRGWLDYGLSGEKASTLLNKSRTAEISDRVNKWLGRGKNALSQAQSKASDYSDSGREWATTNFNKFKGKTLSSLTSAKAKGYGFYDKFLQKYRGDQIYYDDTGAHKLSKLRGAADIGQDRADRILSLIGGRQANNYKAIWDADNRERAYRNNLRLKEAFKDARNPLLKGNRKVIGVNLRDSRESIQSLQEWSRYTFGFDMAYDLVFGKYSDPKYRVKRFD